MRNLTNLDSFLLEVDLEGQLLTQEHVGIMRLVEGSLQLFQLFLREYRSMATFSLRHRAHSRIVRIYLIRMAGVIEGRLSVEGNAGGGHRRDVSSRIQSWICRG